MNLIEFAKDQLANNDMSSDEEIFQLFIENGMSKEEAASWLTLRPQYLLDISCDLEPELTSK